MATPTPPPDAPTGREPELSSGSDSRLSGYEPLLAGVRRPGADPDRVARLVATDTPRRERVRLLDHIAGVGQIPLYAAELAKIVPPRSRYQAGSWRGTFTPGQRRQAMAVLAEVGGYEAVLPLIESLDDDSYDVRQSAASALTAVCRRLPPDDRRTRVVYAALVDALSVLKPGARKVAAGLLGSGPPQAALPALLSAGLGAAEPWVQREAAWALGKLGDRRAAKRLVAALDTADGSVRRMAAWALGRLDAPASIPRLVELMDDRDELVRAAAVEALGALAARLEAGDARVERALAHVAAALKDRDGGVRLAALEALAALDVRAAQAAVLAAERRMFRRGPGAPR